jgi:hypothetical protein
MVRVSFSIARGCLMRGMNVAVLISLLFFLSQCGGGQLKLGGGEVPEVDTAQVEAQSGSELELPGPDLEPVEIKVPKKDCVSGQTKNCGSDVGACSHGTKTCVDEKWGECVGAAGPAAETCDGIDNNCDGTTDEGCDCTDGEERACGPDAVGACKPGKQVCESGKWGQCLGAVNPKKETCDGVDNDCDGTVDEASDIVLPPARLDVGVCQGALKVCDAGALVDPNFAAINGYMAEEQMRCDGLDNDCDGQVDEGCECQPGDVRSCQGSAVGICNPGSQTCIDGLWG